nr:copia protein [Tanacetum cinerariifolium]
MIYQPVTAVNQSNPSDKFDAEKAGEEGDQQYVLFPVWSSGSTNPQNTDEDATFDGKEPKFDKKKPESEVNVSPSSSAQSKKQDDKTKREAKGKSLVESLTGYRDLSAEFEAYSKDSINEVNAADTLVPAVGWIEAMQEELLQFKMQKVWILVDLPYKKRAIGTKWVFRNKNDEKGIVVRNKVRLVAQGHTQEEGIDYKKSLLI